MPILLYLAALILTVCGAIWKKAYALSYLGGLCWAAGTVRALVEGAGLREALIAALLLLSAAWLGQRGRAAK